MRRVVWTIGVLAVAAGVSAATVDELRAKAAALVAEMTVAEKCAQLRNTAPAIPRLGIPAYNYWSEALHGVGRNGRATMFPMPIGMAASFDPALVREIADAIATEGRIKHAASVNPDGSVVVMLANKEAAPKTVSVRLNGTAREVSLPASSVATLAL